MPLTSYFWSQRWDGALWPPAHFEAVTSPGAELPTLTELLGRHLEKNFPEEWNAFHRGESADFPVTVLVGSSLADACAGGHDGNYVIRPLRVLMPYYEQAVEDMSSLLACCQRVLVVGFGTAQHWHLPPSFNDHAHYVTGLFAEHGIPMWDGMSHYLSVAKYRTRVGRYGRVTDWFAHYEEQGRWALTRHFERTLQECLHWSGYNLPLLHPASLDAYMHHVQTNHPIVVGGTAKGLDVDANVSARVDEENWALAGASEGPVVDPMQISSPGSGTARSTSSLTISAARAAATTLSGFPTAEKGTQVQFDDFPSAYAATAFVEDAPTRFARGDNMFGYTSAPNTQATELSEALLQRSGVINRAQLKRTRRIVDC